jgi:hypothetical protein
MRKLRYLEATVKDKNYIGKEIRKRLYSGYAF